MKSILSVYKIGHGPSSSHTVGPYNAAKEYRRRYPDADRIDVTLFGSLAFTGAGHGTEKAIRSAIPEATVHSDRENRDLPHPNTMLFSAYRDGKLIDSTRIFSIGAVPSASKVRIPTRRESSIRKPASPRCSNTAARME